VTLAPLIVTATLGTADQRRFDALRRTHFPPERNYLNAHLTLFHHLPPARYRELLSHLKTVVASAPPPKATVGAVYSLGRGVAYWVNSPELMAIRSRAAEWFSADLTPQDRALQRLHITVQNKVDPADAKALLEKLKSEFVPGPLEITGLAVHYYRGGPWELIKEISFRGSTRSRY
jgi:2'-5' RNA ligase superfamily